MTTSHDWEPPYTGNVALKLKIQSLEATQPRAVREAALNMPGAVARLQTLDNQIAALRAQLTPEDPS